MDANRKASVAGGAVFFVFACVYFVFSDNLPTGGPFDQIGTKFFPKLLATVLGSLSLLLIASSFFAVTPGDDAAPSEQGDRRAFYGTLAVAFLSVVLWRAIGFASVPLLMAGIMIANGARSFGLVAGVAVGGTAVLYFVFFRLFALPLPLGLLE